MLAREKWQIKTIRALEMVFQERNRQMSLHGDAMAYLPDGTGPDERWLAPLSYVEAIEVQEELREDYETRASLGQLTKMHLVREELAEAFELEGDDPVFVEEILQVAALCVQWAELKMED